MGGGGQSETMQCSWFKKERNTLIRNMLHQNPSKYAFYTCTTCTLLLEKNVQANLNNFIDLQLSTEISYVIIIMLKGFTLTGFDSIITIIWSSSCFLPGFKVHCIYIQFYNTSWYLQRHKPILKWVLLYIKIL